MWIGRGSLVHLVVVILCILVIPHANKLLVTVRAREDDGGDADNVLGGDACWVRWVGVEFKRVDADGDGAYETVVEFLVQVEIVGRGDKDELPFDVCVFARGFTSFVFLASWPVEE